MALPEIIYTQRFRLFLHVVQIFLLILAAILTIARLSIKGNVASRAQVMVIVFVRTSPSPPQLPKTPPFPSPLTSLP